MLLNNLHIKGFRGFEDFKVEGLGQVNLIVGRNNAGKTSLLEAIFVLCAKTGNPIATINRGEQFPSGILNVFNGRPTLESSSTMSISSDQRRLDFGLLNGEITVTKEDGTDNSFGIYDPLRYGLSMSPVLMDATTIPRFNIPEFWKSIALTSKEDEVVSCLQLVVPNLERLALVGASPDATPLVRLKHLSRPVSMSTLGGGVVRLFHLACGLISSADSVCLIEEVEHGLHYSVHSEMWKFICSVANRYNIQVFATTHSLDCLRGLAHASHVTSDVTSRVIRMDRKSGKVSPVMFDEEEFQVAAEEEIEIR